MKLYAKQSKSLKGWGYWGDYGEIDLGFSSGYVDRPEDFQPDMLHYHQKGTVFILVMSGSGTIEVNGQILALKTDELLRIDPGEKYRHLDVTETPFSWITVCTCKEIDDKVAVK